MADNIVIKKEKIDEPKAGPSVDEFDTVSEAEIEARIIELMKEFPKGVNDKILQTDMPNLDPKVKVSILNRLLSQGKVNLFKISKELFWCLKEQPSSKFKGTDNEEKIVLRIIEEAGNKGIWHRDIRTKSNLNQTALNKILKALEGKKLIKSVLSVSAAKKKVYMLYNLQPDRSVTGGSWYSPDNEYDSEFVEVLNFHCYRLLEQKAEAAKQLPGGGPLIVRNASFLSSKEICQTIADIKISKVALTVEEIENILDTLVYDGKVEKSRVSDGSSQQLNTYRAVERLLDSAGIVRLPCGICPVIQFCGTEGSVQPKLCVYYSEW